jgi:HAD superfamily hydrolase (TIGR01509 family)
MKPLKLVIFDCDGVMFDSKGANEKYYNHVLAELGYGPMTPEELDFVHIHNVMESIKYLLRDHPEEMDAAEKYRADLDYGQFLQYMYMEKDLIEFLEYLESKGIGAAVSTSRTTTMNDILDIFDLRQYFGKVMTTFDVKNPKPHPEALEVILDHYGMTADEAIYIGDSIIDRQHSAGVNMRLIAFKNPDLEAEYSVTSFMEIVGLLGI